ncbi:hypothetical protein GCM10022215_11830 [Nocardioides fonticola]|uniref:Uncharacterized protein n=1 Tax=Nocardioides fonticola TaxID=450363 RepID=A0ABP7XEV9_9ACTN
MWSICSVLAVVLATGALLIALDAPRANAVVETVLKVADAVDLGVFSRVDGIVRFEGADAATRDALANWGLGAVFYVVMGRVLERVLRS